MSAAATPWVVGGDIRPDPALVGGKAAGLFRLLDLGLPVPRFEVLTVEAFRACCPDGVPAEETPELARALDTLWSRMGAGGTALAVRSSAIDEDGAERSWAGQMQTFLNVVDRNGLARAVLGCWASLSTERARTYRRLTGAADGDTGMAVVVQEMLAPDASGVLFTIDPVKGDHDRVLVSAVLGLGEGLVSGMLDADTYVLDAEGAVVEATLVPKDERVVAEPTGGIGRSRVPEEEAHAAALDTDLLRSLARASRRAASVAGMPLDIEFAVVRGEIFYLQARPVTAAATPPDSAAGPSPPSSPAWRSERPRPPVAPPHDDHVVWDNSNIVESYPGITLPMTFSFIRRAYHAVYWQFCQLLGLGEDEIRAHEHMLRNMLGIHRGQVYYNLRNWYRLVSFLPGFRHNRRFMERMMGVRREGGDPETDRVRRGSGLFALLRTAVRAIWLELTLDRRIRAFHRTFERVHAEFAALPYEEMEPSAVMAEYRRVEQALLWRWKAPIVNDFSVMVFYGLLARLTVAWGVDPRGNAQNALVARQGGIESAEVSERLEALAVRIAEDRVLTEALLGASPADVVVALRRHPVLGPELARYLDRFGDRCVAELKLESRTMHDDPTPLGAALQASLRRGTAPRVGVDGEAERVERLIRERLGPLRRPIYRWVLARARRGIRNRENQRLARTRAFALVRRMVRSVGRRFTELDLLEAADDVFYLELEELMRLCDGTATLVDPKPVVAARKAEYEAFRSGPPLPDRFVTHGPASAAERVAEPDDAPPAAGVALEGLGAYPGVVERAAIVLFEPDPAAGLEDRVLVTRQTDPGWIIVFPSIAGLVVERGSMLSHSAIVAREMGIPAVVGVKGATTAIRSGDVVRLDGSAGTVLLVDPQSGDASRSGEASPPARAP